MNHIKSILPWGCSSIFIFFTFISVSFADICDFHVRVTQDLQNEGFHRKLNYNILFTNEKEEFANSLKGCVIGVRQKLPAGVYANPDEIEDLRRTNQINVVMKSDINVEVSSEVAKPMSFFLKHDDIGQQTSLSIPVHARYHQAVAGGGMAHNQIQPPRVYVRCKDDRFKNCKNIIDNTKPTSESKDLTVEEYKWRQINYTLMTDTPRWDVPVGNTNHYYLVAGVTGFVIVLGSFFMLEAVHEFKIDVKK